VEYLHQESGIRIQLTTPDGVHGAPISLLLVYQVAREAIRNAVTHSKAGTISVLLDGSDKEIGLVVEDDGVGFIPGAGSKSSFRTRTHERTVELAGASCGESSQGLNTWCARSFWSLSDDQ
jgi:signal transduction histidine kinase